MTMERPRTEEIIELLDHFEPTNIEPPKIEESLKILEKEVVSINQNLQEKKKKVTLTQVNHKLDAIQEILSNMNYRM